MDLDKIYHQDCLEGMQRIPDHSIDLAIADLPWLRYEWVVEKSCATGFLNSKRMPLKAHIDIANERIKEAQANAGDV